MTGLRSCQGTETETIDGEIIGQISATGRESDGGTDNIGHIKFVQEGASTATKVPGAITFETADGTISATERVRIDKDGNVGINVTDPHSKLEVNGAISSATSTFSTEGPTDNVDVSGINTLFIDATSNAVTIGGFAGGVAGQRLCVVRCCATANDVTIEHAEGGGSQDIYLHLGADETLNTEYGGWDFVCDGSDWFDVSHWVS